MKKGEIDRLTDAVYEFSVLMLAKLITKAREGYTGWDMVHYRAEIEDQIREKTAELVAGDTKQAVDVANLAMMLDRMPVRKARKARKT